MAKPWEDAPDVWKNETAWCQWLRSQSRRVWSRHPIKNNYVKARMVPVHEVCASRLGERINPRTKMLCKCEMCEEYYPRNKIEVDHIVQAGSFKSQAEYAGWVERLLVVGYEDIRILCKGCHKKVTLSQRFNCSIEEASIRQDMANFKKLRVRDMWALLHSLKITPHPELGPPKKKCEELYERYLRSKSAGQQEVQAADSGCGKGDATDTPGTVAGVVAGAKSRS